MTLVSFCILSFCSLTHYLFLSHCLVTVTLMLSLSLYDYEQAGSHRHLARRDLTADLEAPHLPAKPVLIAQ